MNSGPDDKSHIATTTQPTILHLPLKQLRFVDSDIILKLTHCTHRLNDESLSAVMNHALTEYCRT